MDSMSVVDARERLSDALNRVAYAGERIVLSRRGKRVAALVSIEDLERLEEMEEAHWTREALKAEADASRRGDQSIPFEQVEREIEKARRARRRTGRIKR